MKLAKIFEDIVDLNKFRQAKTKPISVDFDLDKMQKTDQSVQDGLELLVDWIREYRDSFKIPKFQGLNKIFAYLTDELKIPEGPAQVDPNVTNQWYAHLSIPDKHNVAMIINNKDRIIKNLGRIRAETDKFRNTVPKTKNLPNIIDGIYQKIDEEISILDSLSKINA